MRVDMDEPTGPACKAARSIARILWRVVMALVIALVAALRIAEQGKVRVKAPSRSPWF